MTENAAYRPDIDGLRSIAVISVVIFHISQRVLPGGFVGVDMLFVISGYLITGIISREVDRDEFSYKRFYERRVRRIAPALFAMLAFATFLTIYLLPPAELVQYGYSLAGAIFSSSNLYFWHVSNYFAQDSSRFLLHTWSLL